MNRKLYQTIVTDRSHRLLRRELPEIAEEYSKAGLSPEERMTRRFEGRKLWL